jgi:hypothetical protein
MFLPNESGTRSPYGGWACRDGMAIHPSSLQVHLTRPSQGTLSRRMWREMFLSGYDSGKCCSSYLRMRSPVCSSTTSWLNRCMRVKPVLRGSTACYHRRGDHHFVRKRVPAISGRREQPHIALSPRKGNCSNDAHEAECVSFLPSSAEIGVKVPRKDFYGR